MSCGNSSMCNRRTHLPTGVIRGSFAVVHWAPPSRSASATIVRSLMISKIRPPRPTLGCRMNTDPALSIRIATAATTSGMHPSTIPIAAPARSSARLPKLQ